MGLSKGIVRSGLQQTQKSGESQQQDRRHGRQQGIAQKPHEHVQQQQPVGLQENDESQGDSGMVQDNFMSPGVGPVARTEVNKGDCEEKERHGRDDAQTGALEPALLPGQGRGRQERQRTESECDQEQSEPVGGLAPSEQFRHVGDHRGQGQQVTANENPALAGTQREMEQDARKQT